MPRLSKRLAKVYGLGYYIKFEMPIHHKRPFNDGHGLEHFPKSGQEVRKNKEIERGFDSIKTGNALAGVKEQVR